MIALFIRAAGLFFERFSLSSQFYDEDNGSNKFYFQIFYV